MSDQNKHWLSDLEYVQKLERRVAALEEENAGLAARAEEENFALHCALTRQPIKEGYRGIAHEVRRALLQQSSVTPTRAAVAYHMMELAKQMLKGEVREKN